MCESAFGRPAATKATRFDADTRESFVAMSFDAMFVVTMFVVTMFVVAASVVVGEGDAAITAL
jgi:hypothetical protein